MDESPAFALLAETSAKLAGTRSRLEKKRLLVEMLERVPPAEVAAAVGWLVGEPRCGPLGVGPAQLWELAKTGAPEGSSITLRDVEGALERAKGEAHAERLATVAALFAKLTAPQRSLFAGALTGSLRQGSLGGVMLLAVAERAKQSEADVRRTVLLRGSIVDAAGALLGPKGESEEEAPQAGVVLFRPIAPMLAAPAASVEEAMQGSGARVEWKIDGVRAQVHKEGERVRVYSRHGNDITEGCEPLLPSFASLAARAVVLDGEVVRVGPDGRARAFQDSFSSVASKGALAEGDAMRVYFFDCLHRDGMDLLDAPLASRVEALREVVPPELLVPAVTAVNAEEAARFYAEAVAAGSEGVMVKDLASPYRFGARGRAWQKVKEHATVDLVVLAAEWGHGRRTGSLSNLHLGARRDDGTFCMIGKTFKGLTDAMLRWQTERLQELAVERTDYVVYVRPELVVEIRFNDVQRSTRYPGGIALRFARVVRYREDKPATEIEPLASLVARLPKAASGDDEPAPAKPAPKKPPKKQLSLFDD